MTKRIFAALIIVVLLFSAGCGSHVAAVEMNGDKLNIVTTVFPAYDFARQVAGDEADVTLLVPPGTEIHGFEPTAKDIISIEKCDLLVCNGGESEAWLEEILSGLENDIKVVTMLDCVETLEEEIKEGMEETAEEHESDEIEYDEHVWTSPVNAKLICREICSALCEVESEKAAEFNANCESFCEALSELDKEFRDVVASASANMLIFADRFPVRYFVEEYGLDYYAAFAGCADDAEASAKTVRFLIDKVKENNVPAVMYIEFSNEKMADIICEDTGCNKLLFHSCHNVSADDMKNGVTYIQLMKKNVESLREALG